MVGAVRLAFDRRHPAEMEVGLARIAERPEAPGPLAVAARGGPWRRLLVQHLAVLRLRLDRHGHARRRRLDRHRNAAPRRNPLIPADRRGARLQPQAVRLADDGVLGNPEETANRRGAVARFPETGQFGDTFIGPAHMESPRVFHQIL